MVSRLLWKARRGLSRSRAAHTYCTRVASLASADQGKQTVTHRALHRALGTRSGDGLSAPTPPLSLIALRTSPRAAKADCSYIFAQRYTARKYRF